jgi:proline iminopeptidase
LRTLFTFLNKNYIIKYMQKELVPIKKGFLKLQNHKVYYAVYGNPNGRPWMFCHGGPGYHCVPKSNLKNFNLNTDMVILFDQRGSGKSRPSTELKNNTTANLVQDMSEILKKLKVSKVSLLGSSWGTTLALVFSIQYPHLVNSLVLKSVFLGRKKDIWDIYKPSPLWSMNQLEKFEATLGELKKEFKIKNFLTDGLKILKKRDHSSLRFAKLWAAYEDLICSKKWSLIDFDKDYLKMAMDISSIEIHYFKNNCFLPINYILRNASKISHIPTSIIHGAQDMVCNQNQAIRLQIALKKAILYIDPVGGHSSTKRMTKEVKRSIKKLGKIK